METALYEAAAAIRQAKDGAKWLHDRLATTPEARDVAYWVHSFLRDAEAAIALIGKADG
jgi:hypothetical protein